MTLKQKDPRDLLHGTVERGNQYCSPRMNQRPGGAVAQHGPPERRHNRTYRSSRSNVVVRRRRPIPRGVGIGSLVGASRSYTELQVHSAVTSDSYQPSTSWHPRSIAVESHAYSCSPRFVAERHARQRPNMQWHGGYAFYTPHFEPEHLSHRFVGAGLTGVRAAEASRELVHSITIPVCQAPLVEAKSGR